MHLSSLSLEQFRSYTALSLEIPPQGLRVIGPNASGKSTLLESVLLLATLKGARSANERELVCRGSGEEFGLPPFARVGGTVITRQEQLELQIALQVDPETRSARKTVSVDGVSKRVLDAVGLLKVVSFSPEDVSLLAGPPAQRRRYLDVMLSQVDRRYLRALSRYVRVLSQRNGLLRALSRDRASPNAPATLSQLAFWDDEVIAAGATVIAHRLLAVSNIDGLANARFGQIAEGSLSATYRSNVVTDGMHRYAIGTNADDLGLVVAREWTQQLASVRAEEIRRGLSLLGPQRDDFSLAIDDMDVGVYGSRGQQRLSVVALKLAEADLMRREAMEPPTVLLDDVFSELDGERAEHLIGTLSALGCQLIVTATERERLSTSSLSALPWFQTRAVVREPA
ncbi:MAG TPA: DNA replication and repair protein RecF [Thermomicrobiales bacterium]|nr:DNA replication and repair protein RecF [Thermomicrobiales bacterium]